MMDVSTAAELWGRELAAKIFAERVDPLESIVDFNRDELERLCASAFQSGYDTAKPRAIPHNDFVADAENLLGALKKSIADKSTP